MAKEKRGTEIDKQRVSERDRGKDTERETETHRKRERQTDRERERETDRQTERERERDIPNQPSFINSFNKKLHHSLNRHEISFILFQMTKYKIAKERGRGWERFLIRETVSGIEREKGTKTKPYSVQEAVPIIGNICEFIFPFQTSFFFEF